MQMHGSMHWGGGAKYGCKVKLWASWFCMDGGDEQAFSRGLDISANLNPAMSDAEEDVVLCQRTIFDLHTYFDGGWEEHASNGGGWV